MVQYLVEKSCLATNCSLVAKGTQRNGHDEASYHLIVSRRFSSSKINMKKDIDTKLHLLEQKFVDFFTTTRRDFFVVGIDEQFEVG